MLVSRASAIVLAGGAVQNVPRAGTTGGAGTGMRYLGLNIAGFDFGASTQGAYDFSQTKVPLASAGTVDGVGQMQHFVRDYQMDMFRLPVGWQYLLNNKLGAPLDATNFGKYDQLVQGCTNLGAHCIVDIHNYARWNGKIIGQSDGGPTNANFVDTWTQLAKNYANQSKVVFGLMNEPHDVPDNTKWAATVQAAVTAIRGAGATSQMILIPGNAYSSAKDLPTGAGPALLKVTNPNGTMDGLVFDVHKYLDSDNSGTHTECVTDNVQDTFMPLAKWLRANNRTALLSETGGGNTASCSKYFCQQLDYINQNPDVFLGVTGWSAGAFAANYELNMVPTQTKDTGTWTDQPLVKACLAKAR